MAFRVVSGIHALGGGVASWIAIPAPHDPTQKRAQPAEIDGIDLVGRQATAADGDLAGEMAILGHVQSQRPEAPCAKAGADLPNRSRMPRHGRGAFTVLQQGAPPRVPKR